MIRRNKKTRKYQAPFAKVAQMALESNFCTTVRFNVQVNDWENMNSPTDATKGTGEAANEVFYFESY